MSPSYSSIFRTVISQAQTKSGECLRVNPLDSETCGVSFENSIFKLIIENGGVGPRA